MKLYPLLLFLLLSSSLYAQLEAGLIAYYSFDNDDDMIIIDETGNFANNGISTANQYDCGVLERSIRFDGENDKIDFEGSAVRDVFGTEDFSLSFYIKPLNSNQAANQTILYKREDCSNDNALAIRYTPNSNMITAVVSENPGFNAILSGTLNSNHCWHHLLLMRKGTTIFLYIDGRQVDSDTKPQRIDISSDALPLVVGQSSCSATDNWYEGFLDELRLYDRALTSSEIEGLYLRPDQIGNGYISLTVGKDTVLYLGNSFTPYITNTCADEFLWTPAAGVSNQTDATPVLSPTESTTYQLAFTDNFGCVATDTLRVTVIDPATLDCQAFLPNAFTPNNDGLNDDFGLDNPFALSDFISIEVFDRWGSRMFYSTDPFARWNGNFRGQILNPGVFLYKVRYRCSGEERIKSGNLTILR